MGCRGCSQLPKEAGLPLAGEESLEWWILPPTVEFASIALGIDIGEVCNVVPGCTVVVFEHRVLYLKGRLVGGFKERT